MFHLFFWTLNQHRVKCACDSTGKIYFFYLGQQISHKIPPCILKTQSAESRQTEEDFIGLILANLFFI